MWNSDIIPESSRPKPHDELTTFLLLRLDHYVFISRRMFCAAWCQFQSIIWKSFILWIYSCFSLSFDCFSWVSLHTPAPNIVLWTELAAYWIIVSIPDLDCKKQGKILKKCKIRPQTSPDYNHQLLIIWGAKFASGENGYAAKQWF